MLSSTSAEGVGGDQVPRCACLDPRVLRCARSKRPSGPGSRCAAAGQPAAGRAAAWGVVWTRRSGAEGRSRAAGAGGAGIVRKRFRCACPTCNFVEKRKTFFNKAESSLCWGLTFVIGPLTFVKNILPFPSTPFTFITYLGYRDSLSLGYSGIPLIGGKSPPTGGGGRGPTPARDPWTKSRF